MDVCKVPRKNGIVNFTSMCFADKTDIDGMCGHKASKGKEVIISTTNIIEGEG